MRNKKELQALTTEIVDKMRALAVRLKLDSPCQLTRVQVIRELGVSDYSIRMLGGLDSIKARYFAPVEKDLPGVRVAAEVKTKIRKLEKALAEKELFEERMHADIMDAIKILGLPKVTLPEISRDKNKRSLTMELMLSDIHYGLKTKEFNLEICRRRIVHLVDVFLKDLAANRLIYNVDRVIVALLGDIIQSATMHSLESAMGCEFGNSMQVQAAIQSLWEDVMVPIASTGIQMDIPAVTGNHDRSEIKRTMNYPGSSNLTWIIYRTLEMLCKEAGFKNVNFIIPDGSYVVLEIYGHNCLYEHGDNSKANSKNAFEALLQNRSKQADKVIHFGRFGHFHELKVYGRGRIIVNESVCGEESYGHTLGYKSVAGQCINTYVETKSNRTPFFKTFAVCLESIK